VPLRGIWVSSSPLADDEGADGDQLLQLELPEAVALEHEVVEDGKPYREFPIPTDVLNQHGTTRLVSPEEDEMIDQRFLPPDRLSERRRSSRAALPRGRICSLGLSTCAPVVRVGHTGHGVCRVVLVGQRRPQVDKCIGFVGALSGTESVRWKSTPDRTA
jgi:hypothetical protein